MENLLQQLQNLSIDELRTINSAAVDLIKHKHKTEALTLKHRVSVGDTVLWDRGNGKTETFEVLDKKKTRFVGKMSNGMRYNVPFSGIVAINGQPV